MTSETKTRVLVATDFDGTFGKDTVPMPPSEPQFVISGRTFQEYDGNIGRIAKDMPVYIRGSGEVGDAAHAGKFKAEMIEKLGVTHFLEDDPTQIAIIRKKCPNVVVCVVPR